MLKTITAAALALALLSSTANATVCYKEWCKPPVKPAPGHTYGSGGGPWLIFICAGGIISTAIWKSATQNRELTSLEAWTCGVAALGNSN